MVFPVDCPGEQHSVAVVGEEVVFALVERLEVFRPCDSDSGTMVSVAPGDVVFVLYLDDSWVISVDPLSDFFVGAIELDGFLIDVPLDTVIRKSRMQGHSPVFVVAAEHSREPFPERNHRRVEDAVGIRQQVSGYYGIL